MAAQYTAGLVFVLCDGMAPLVLLDLHRLSVGMKYSRKRGGHLIRSRNGSLAPLIHVVFVLFKPKLSSLL